jgi:hypothetical protein
MINLCPMTMNEIVDEAVAVCFIKTKLPGSDSRLLLLVGLRTWTTNNIIITFNHSVH